MRPALCRSSLGDGRGLGLRVGRACGATLGAEGRGGGASPRCRRRSQSTAGAPGETRASTPPRCPFEPTSGASSLTISPQSGDPVRFAPYSSATSQAPCAASSPSARKPVDVTTAACAAASAPNASP